jgi:hypothetical protein
MRNSRWNKDQETVLVSTIGKSSTTNKGIRSASRKLKRSVGSCAQRYYLLQRRSDKRVEKRMPNAKQSTLLPIQGTVKAITISKKGIRLIF